MVAWVGEPATGASPSDLIRVLTPADQDSSPAVESTLPVFAAEFVVLAAH
jgi:hypothetical protein